MKVLLGLALTVSTITCSVFAAGNADNFAELKTNALKNIDARISTLNATKNCINSAKDHNALRACRMERKDQMKEHRQAAKQRHQSFKQKKMEQKASKKQTAQ